MHRKKRFSFKRLNEQEINYIFTFKSYTIIVFNNGTNQAITLPLGRLERRLSREDFFRNHRSYLVNINQIDKVEIIGEQLFIIAGGHKLPVARRRKRRLLELLGVVR